MNSTSPARRFYLITIPRTASNLLVKMLGIEEQPQILHRRGGGYFFLPYVMQANDVGIKVTDPDSWTEEQKVQMKTALQTCFDDFDAYLSKAESEGKIAYVKEHADFLIDPHFFSLYLEGKEDDDEKVPWRIEFPESYGKNLTRSPLNQTLLPDQFLETFLPTFLIRHPALAFPSMYRATRDLNFNMSDERRRSQMKFHWNRNLYTWYSKLLGKTDASDASAWPIVIDADDVISSPAMIRRYCKIVGLDEGKLRFEWNVTSEEDKWGAPNPKVAARMLSTLHASTGVMPGKLSTGIEIDVEAKKWREEFGEEDGIKVERWVREAMPDYEFLKARRLRAEGTE